MGAISENLVEADVRNESSLTAVEDEEGSSAAVRVFTSRTLSTTSRCASNASAPKPKTTWPVNCEVVYTKTRMIHQNKRYGAPNAFPNPKIVTCLVALLFASCWSVEICKHSGISHQSVVPPRSIALMANHAKLVLAVLKILALSQPMPRSPADSTHSRSQYALPARRVGVKT